MAEIRLTQPQIRTLQFLESCGRAGINSIGDHLYPAIEGRGRPTRRTRQARASIVVQALRDRGLIEPSLTMYGYVLSDAGRAWLTAGGRLA